MYCVINSIEFFLRMALSQLSFMFSYIRYTSAGISNQNIVNFGKRRATSCHPKAKLDKRNVANVCTHSVRSTVLYGVRLLKHFRHKMKRTGTGNSASYPVLRKEIKTNRFLFHWLAFSKHVSYYINKHSI